MKKIVITAVKRTNSSAITLTVFLPFGDVMAIKTVVMALMKLKIVEHEHVLKIGSVVIIRVNAYHLYGFVTAKMIAETNRRVMNIQNRAVMLALVNQMSFNVSIFNAFYKVFTAMETTTAAISQTNPTTAHSLSAKKINSNAVIKNVFLRLGSAMELLIVMMEKTKRMVYVFTIMRPLLNVLMESTNAKMKSALKQIIYAMEMTTAAIILTNQNVMLMNASQG
jgi:hypothetical protein